MRDVYIIAHDIRSTHNIGSLFRTAEGLGIKKLYLTGYTPYPSHAKDRRLPHEAKRITDQINKTALGAIEQLAWQKADNILPVIDQFEEDGTTVIAIEQSPNSIALHAYDAPDKVAIILGNEITGLPANILERIKIHVSIPMFGRKESFNVVQAAAMALYKLRFH